MKSKLNIKSIRLMAIAAAFALICSFAAIIRAGENSPVAQNEAVNANVTQVLNGKIAFQSNRDGNYEIYTMNPDGWNVTNVTNNPAYDLMPTFSPDGSRIAFISNRDDGVYCIYMMNADGTNVSRLPNSASTQSNVSFSPDGSRIAFVSAEYGNQIAVMNIDGTNLQVLTDSPGVNIEPSFSPDGSKIVFESQRDSDKEIYIMNADGSDETRLTGNVGYDSQPSFSPDGSKIVFWSFRNGEYNIYTMDLGGLALRKVTEDDGFSKSSASFSPDGSKIIFTSNRIGYDLEIYSIDPDGGNLKRLTTDLNYSDDHASWQSAASVPPTLSINDTFDHEPVPDFAGKATFTVTLYPASQETVTVDYATADFTATRYFDYTEVPTTQLVFSPGETSKQIEVSLLTDFEDEVMEKFHVNLSNPSNAVIEKGQGVGAIRTEYTRNGKIAFRSVRDGNSEIYIMNADGSEQTNLTNHPGNDYNPAFSPDGSRIVFDSDRDGNREIYVMNADGSNQMRLTDNSFSDSDPAFSPDGRTIVFTSIRYNHADIFLMSADGSGQTRLTTNLGNDWEPSYSPDGTKIVFISNRPGTSNYRIHLMDANGANERLFSEQSQYDSRPLFSPYGERIIFDSFRGNIHDIYTLTADGEYLTILTSATEFDKDASYSPDNHSIVLSSSRGEGFEIYTKKPYASEETRLTDNNFADDSPRWQPAAPLRCAFELVEYNAWADGGGSSGSISVTANDSSCGWSATSHDNWIHVNNSQTQGSGEKAFTVDANNGVERQGTITVAGFTFTVYQGEGFIDVSMPADLIAQGSEQSINVPVVVEDSTTNRGVISFDLSVGYNRGVVRAYPFVNKTGAMSENMDVQAVEEDDEIKVSGYGTTPLSGQGTLVFIKFAIMGEPGECTNLNLGIRFNEGNPASRDTGGRICIASTVSGKVLYFSGAQTLGAGNVLMSVTGESSFSTTTAADGSYALDKFGSGSYTVKPSKSGDLRGAITGFDASKIVRVALGIDPANQSQRIASDVSQNDEVTSYDAALTAQYAVGIPNPGFAGKWRFLPASRDYVDLEENKTEENYLAILVGDASGDWSIASRLTGRGEAKTQTAANAVAVTLPTLAAERDQIINVPVSTADITGRGFRAYDMEIAFDPAVLQLDSVDKNATVSNSLNVVANPNTPGSLLVTAYNAHDMQGAGTLLNLRFRVVGQIGQISPLTFRRLVFNEDAAQSVTQNGQITVTAPTAQVNVGGRVTTAKGVGIKEITLTMSDAQGNRRATFTDESGFYRFEGVPVGSAYVISVSGKQYTFKVRSQTTNITGETGDINFVANELRGSKK